MTLCGTTDNAELAEGVIEFDMYAVPPPQGDWEYAIDDYGIIYRRGLVAQRLRPGWWPFAYEDPKREHWTRRGRVPPIPVECGAASVRLAPDYDEYSWCNEYVTVMPDRLVPHHATAQLTLWVRTQGMGGMVTRCRVQFDLLANTHKIRDLHPALPAEVKAQGEEKAAKLSAFLAAEVKHRDGPLLRPATVEDRVRERRNRPGQWREPDPRNGRPGWSRDIGGERYLLVCQVGDRWRWAMCRYDGAALLAAGGGADAEEAMVLADAAVHHVTAQCWPNSAWTTT